MENSASINQGRPKIGLAFAGASSRSVFYIGFLEVLQENNFQVDYVAALSGGSIVAAAYACGTLSELKHAALSIDKEFIFSLIERSKTKGGLYNLEKVEEMLLSFTKSKKFEDVYPRLGIGATDIDAGEAVFLEMGDIARAICASCSLPFIFEPVPWGNRLLVDGGVAGVVPVQAARNAGMDIVIGIDLSGKMHVFSWWQVWAGRIVWGIKRLFLVDQASYLWLKFLKYIDRLDLFANYSPLLNEAALRRPGMFTVLGRSVDVALAAQKKEDPRTSDYGADLLIRPEMEFSFWRKYLLFLFTDFSKIDQMYQLGRETAKEVLPKLNQLIKNHDGSAKS